MSVKNIIRVFFISKCMILCVCCSNGHQSLDVANVNNSPHIHQGDSQHSTTYMKPGVAIRLENSKPVIKYDLIPFVHTVSFDVGDFVDYFDVTVTHSENVSVALNNSDSMTIEYDSSNEESYELNLNISPIDYGKYYVTFHMSSEGGSRVLSQVIKFINPNEQVGEVQESSFQKASSSKQTAIKLKAEETIIQQP